MSRKTLPPAQRSGPKGGRFFPALCTFIGILLIAAVILVCVPLIVPRFMGYEIYEVVSGSMEPTIPVGSVVYVGEITPKEVQPGDVIAFTREDSIVTHRVVENRSLEGVFITKGDANQREDVDKVPYKTLVGRVEHHFPVVGRVMKLYASSVGKIYLLGIVTCGFLLLALAGLLRRRRNTDDTREKLLEELRQELVKQSASAKEPPQDASSDGGNES